MKGTDTLSRLLALAVAAFALTFTAGSLKAQNPSVDLFRDATVSGAPECNLESCLNIAIDSVAQSLCAVVVLDASTSMTVDSTADGTQTRFQGARQAIKEFVSNFDNATDQFGLVKYGTQDSVVVAPVTTDTAAAQAAIDDISEPIHSDSLTGLETLACAINQNSAACPLEFTNIADGYRTGIGLLSECTEGSKRAIIVSSDGVANRATINGTFTSCVNQPTAADYPNPCTSKAISLTDTATAASADVYSIAIALDQSVEFDSLGIVTMDSIASEPQFFFNTFVVGSSPAVFDSIAADLEVKSITNTVLEDTLATCWGYVPGSATGPGGEPAVGVDASGDTTLQWNLGTVPGADTTTVCYDMRYDASCGGDNPSSVDVNISGGATFTQFDNTVQTVIADTITVDLSACTNLPVELTEFQAKATEQNVALTWVTASELNNAGFSVEHALEGGFYEEIGFVEGQGTTNRENVYTFEVKELEPGNHFFRLKQVDFDGAFSFSPELEVAVEVPDDYHLSEVYPNPFNPQASIRFWVARSQRVVVTLHDVAGRQVATLYDGTPAEKHSQLVMIDGSSLSSGSYLVRMQGENFVETRNMVLLK